MPVRTATTLFMYVNARLWTGWHFVHYLYLGEGKRTSGYAKELLKKIVEPYVIFTGGKCCSHVEGYLSPEAYAKKYEEWWMLHDRRGLGGYFPGTVTNVKLIRTSERRPCHIVLFSVKLAVSCVRRYIICRTGRDPK